MFEFTISQLNTSHKWFMDNDDVMGMWWPNNGNRVWTKSRYQNHIDGGPDDPGRKEFLALKEKLFKEVSQMEIHKSTAYVNTPFYIVGNVFTTFREITSQSHHGQPPGYENHKFQPWVQHFSSVRFPAAMLLSNVPWAWWRRQTSFQCDTIICKQNMSLMLEPTVGSCRVNVALCIKGLKKRCEEGALYI